MKGLVLLGEGHGDAAALPVLIRRLLEEKDTERLLYVDHNMIRFGSSRVMRWDKERLQPDYTEWIKGVTLAARRKDTAAVLAVYDGDLKHFPPGSGLAFCAGAAAKSMASAAAKAGAGKQFSLSVVFACVEYETWIVAGAESLRGRRLRGGPLALPNDTPIPAGDPESHGKRWLEKHYPGYRPSLDQAAFTEVLDFECVRSKGLRSFRRLEHALEEVLEAVATNAPIVTPS